MRTDLSTNELRQLYLDFFKEREHLIYPSASLNPNDPTLLFTAAGMVQFKPYFLGATPKFAGFDGVWHRTTTAQKCIRINDIENVGRTLRHHSFFEMMGNFSFGDYFKKEATTWAWEFLTEVLKFDPEKLYVTIYETDDEAFDVWTQHVGVPAERISRWGEDENFWPANAVSEGPNGPCGPCSEIFYDRGPEFGSEDEVGPNTGSGDRFIEIWNLVFTQSDRQEDGSLIPLPQNNIDTGLGFERLVAVINGLPDAYASDLFQPTIQKVAEVSGVEYKGQESLSHRVIADHIRAVTFSISDGVLPTNDGAGYIVKMLLRRAARHAYLLGIREAMLYTLVDQVVESMGEAYAELEPAKERVAGVIKTEEELFLRTLESGIRRVGTIFEEMDGTELDGAVAFDLWQTYGFPLDITEEMAEEQGITVDRAGYEAASEKAKLASKGDTNTDNLFAAQKDTLGILAKEHGDTDFVGYEETTIKATAIALVSKDSELVEIANIGDELVILLDKTPFYAESGGQVGDAGTIDWETSQESGRAIVISTSKSPEGLVKHNAKVVQGSLQSGQGVIATVDLRRQEIAKHHTATHLLHESLQQILGNHVGQAGSLVEPERLRFDFTHPKALDPDELEKIEYMVNGWIQDNLAVSWQDMPKEEASKLGAQMLFGEKYGDIVRVVSIGEGDRNMSREFCGGTHTRSTGTIGAFMITSEEAVSAGVRRIEAVSGEAIVSTMQGLRASNQATAKQLNTSTANISERIEKLQADLKASQRDNATLRDKLAAAQTSGGASNEVKEAGGYSYTTAILEGLDSNALRNAADNMLQKSGADVVVLASGQLLVTKVSKDAQGRGANAGSIIREVASVAGGGGGGRPDMAQAGVKDTGKLPDAMAAVAGILEGLAA